MSLVLYDDDCNICKTIAVALLDWDRSGRLRAAPLQGLEGERWLADLSPHARAASFHYIDDRGRRHSGGEGLAPLLAELPAGAPLATLLRGAPGLTDAGYRWVAAHREGISRFVPEALKARARRRLGA